MKTRMLIVLCLGLFLLSVAPAFGLGKGGGKGKPGQGDNPCVGSPASELSRAVVFDGVELSIGNQTIDSNDSLRLANRITAVERGGDFLVAGTMTTNAGGPGQLHRLVILTFDPGPGPGTGTGTWTLVRIINTQALSVSEDDNGPFFSLDGRNAILADLDGDGDMDDLLAGNQHVVAFFNVDVANGYPDGTPPAYEVLETPTGAERFGKALAFGDVTGDDLPEIIVGAYWSNEVFVYDVDFSKSNPFTLLTNLASSTDDLFGSSVAVGGDGALYVGAPWAKVDKKNEAGKVFRFPDPVSTQDPLPVTELQRQNPQRRERLGNFLVVAAVTDPNGVVEELVAAPERSGGSLAFFDLDTGQETATLDTTPDLGGFNSLSAAPGVVVAGAPNGNCGGVVYKWSWDGTAFSREILLTPDPAPAGGNFGWGSYAVGDYIFVTEKGRDQDENGIDEGQIYVIQ